MNGCIIEFHNVPKVNDIIKELENNNPKDCYKLSALLKTEEFLRYCKEDKVANTDILENINKNVLRRLIKEYRNMNVFNINNTSKVNLGANMYQFRSQEAFDTAVQFTADLISNINYKAPDSAKASNNYITSLIATAKLALKKQLVLKANQYGQFDINNMESVYYAIEENGTDQERNFKDLVQSALGDTSFWNEVFYNNKISALGRDINFDDEGFKLSLIESVNEDVIQDIEQSDEIDLSTKQWDFGNNVSTFTEHISSFVRQYFDSLQKLNSTQKYSDGKYDIDRNNPLGVPTCHTYQECTIELTNVISNLGGFKSINDFIKGIETIANNKQEFASFIKVADDMKANPDLANKIYTDLNKFVIDKLEISIDGFGSIKSVQSNNSNNPVRKLYFNLRNDLKGSSIQNDNIYIEEQIKELENKFKQYKSISNIGGVKSARRGNLQTNIEESNNIKFDEIIKELKDLYKTYFPSINDLAIDSYINKNNNTSNNYKNDNIDKLLSYLYNVNNSAKLSLAEKEDREFKRNEVQKENRKKFREYQEALAAGITTAKYKEKELPKYDGEYLKGADEVIGNIAKAVETYTYSKAELNSRNTEGNLNSDVIYNNFITNIAKICGNRDTLNAWVKEKLKSTEFEYSNILIDNPNQGIIGLFRKKINGEYELSPYGEKIISPYLLNGVSNQQYGTNANYAKMSDGDYFLTGLYAYMKKLQTYKQYNTVTANGQEIQTVPFLMRIPSDAPKNFAITMPKYSINNLWNYDNAAMSAYVSFRKPNFIKIADNSISDEQLTKLKSTNINIDELINLVTNTPDQIKTSPVKILSMFPKVGETQTIAYAIVEPNVGVEYHYFSGTLIDDGKGNYYLNKPTYKGQASFNSFSDKYRNAITKYIEDEFKTNHPESRTINQNHPIFNSFKNIVKGEIFDYYKALYDIEHNNKENLIEWFHYNPKKGIKADGKLTGNAFTFSKLDSIVGIDVNKELNDLIASPTGGGTLIGYTDSANASASINFSTEQETVINDIVTRWIDAYQNYFINEVNNKFSSFIDNVSNEDLSEFGLNSYIHFNNFDDLYEGNSKYYKDPQTFLKRAKECQAGGTSYSISNYNNTQITDSPFTQSVNEIPNTTLTYNGNPIIVNGKELTLRSGWNGVVIKNSIRTSSNKNLIYNKLIESGLSKERAKSIAEGFGYSPVEDGENSATTTTVNDAQSYITIYEAARRLKILGEYNKYEKLIGQLTDDTTDIKDINPNKLESFIQVMKNFYFDHYYNNKFGRHLPRQIKNAEFVLVPKFLKDTSLGQLCDIMIANDIDQINTQETSKAANYDVLTFWDNEGNVTEDNLKDFTSKISKVKQPFSYMYLYKQQDVPQHITNAKNKAGIQVMKKILDNSQSVVSTHKNNFIKAYVSNIKEDFNNLMDKYGIKFDKDYNIVGDDNNSIDYTKIYKSALIEASRLGLDSNTLDYLTIKGNDRKPVMPNYMNIVSSKIESIAQSQFNKFITRQKLPGWHGAQVTSVGMEGLIKQYKRLNTGESIETDTGKRIELGYHNNGAEVEILLPKWAKNMFNQFDEDGNLVKEINIEDVDEEVLKCIGYRIPTEGKQSMAVMKIVGFLPEWMGSTIVVPDEWVTQTGSDFDVDSVYGIAYETYLGKDNRIHKIEYIEGIDEDSTKERYINYVSSRIGKRLKATMFSESTLSKDEIKTLRSEVKKSIKDSLGFVYDAENAISERIESEFKQNLFDSADWYASQTNLLSYKDFSNLTVEDQNNRRARNNRILDSMIAIMNDKSSLEENLARSNFEDIAEANKKLNKLDNQDSKQRNVYNLFDQIQFHRNAMGGATLKAFSVSRDTGNSIFNVTKTKLSIPIKVKYGNNVNLDIANEAFPVVNGIVYHDRIGNSKNNKNVIGEYITVASSHTTAHILDAIKEGAIKNENEYTFAAFKTLFDIGCDAYTAMLWLRQPGISKIVEAYYESQSVFVKGNYNPIHTAIKRIANKLGAKINNEIITDNNNINEVINALNRQYGEAFKELFPNSKIGFENNYNADVNIISVPDIEERFKLENDGQGNEETALLLDLGVIINFNYINNYSTIISNHIKVLNPDKFGAKQTIFGTRKVIKDINTIIKNGDDKLLMVEDKTLIESIYPGITMANEYDFFMPRIYLSANNNDSSYQILDSFLRNSTVPSILINKGLFETESTNFVGAIEGLQNYISGTINEKLYNDFKKYVLEYNYKINSRVISSPIYLGKNGIIEIDNESAIKSFENGSTPLEDEQKRLYGYGYDINYSINIANIANPTKEEIKEFNKLTPAQKVQFVQQHLTDSQRNIFNHLNVNLFNGYEFKTKGVSSQVIRFDDQQQSMEVIYKMFNIAFNNSNPIIRLTAIDLIKYAFVVEGYQFKRGNISKIIRNNTLYTSIENGGTNIIDDIKDSVNNISDRELIANNIYEDYLRSHSNIPQIQSYRVKIKNGKSNLSYLNNSNKMYYFNLTNGRDIELAKEIGIVKYITSKNGETKSIINSSYINIIRGKDSTLYKIQIHGTETNKELYLIPLNKLEENEHGEFSVNPINNKYPSTKYYNAIIQESIDKQTPFSRLADENNRLFTKEGINEYKYKKPEVNKEIIIPTDENFISSLASTDYTVKNLIKNINDKFENNAKIYWTWNSSQILKQAFGTINAQSKQIILDNNGKAQSYLIKRVNIKTNKNITSDEQLEGIELAKRNGIKQLDTIYVVTPYKESEIVEREVNPEDSEHASSIDMDITNTNISTLGNLAQEFILDIKTRSRVNSDEEAVVAYKDIKNYGVNENDIMSIEDNKQDTIKRASEFYRSKANEIKYRIENFIKDTEGDYNNIISSYTIDAIKNNEELRNQYISLVLQASTFGNSFPLINEIATDNLDDSTRRNIKDIQDTINSIKNNPIIKEAFKVISENIYKPLSTNPNFSKDLTNITDYILKDASVLDWLFQDAQEISYPIVQVILKQAKAKLDAKMFEGDEYLIIYNKKLKDIKSKAASAGKLINYNNIISPVTGKFISNFTDSFIEDKNKSNNEAKDALNTFGRNSKEHLRALHEKDKFYIDNVEQKYIKEYYQAKYDNEHKMLNDYNVDYYIKYINLNEEYNKLLRILKNNRTEEQNNRIKVLKSEIAEMQNTVDFNTGEWKSQDEFNKAVNLKNYIDNAIKIKKAFFDRETREGFERDLNYYINIINKYKHYDSFGRQIENEYSLLQIDEYAKANEWLNENTYYRISEALQNEINNAFTVLNNDKKEKNPQFKSIIQHTSNVYDNYGIIDGSVFSKEQIEAIKKEQQSQYDSRNNDGSSAEEKLIRNRPTINEIYTKAFYDKFNSKSVNETEVVKTSRIAITKKINNILKNALNPSTGKLKLSDLSKEELRELSELYDKLGEIKRLHRKDDKVKKFIKEEVDFNNDKITYAIDEDAAKQKDKKDKGFYAIWKTIANSKEYDDNGNLIGFKDEPNSDIYGYITPKLNEQGEVINKDYVDKKRSDAIKFLNENIEFVPTQYYWKARENAIKEGKLKEFEEENHIYNSFTGKTEPIRVWTTISVKDQTNNKSNYVPSYNNTRTKPKEETINYKHNRYSPNYNGSAKYKKEDNANEYEKELRDLMQGTLYDLTKSNSTAIEFVSKMYFPRRGRKEANLVNITKTVLNAIGYGETLDPDRHFSDNIGYEYDKETNIPLLNTLKDKSYKEYITKPEQGLTESDEDYNKRLNIIKEQNKEIKKFNDALDVKLMDKDYESVFEEFIKGAVRANAKEETKLDLYFLLEYMKTQAQAYRVTGFNNLSVDRRKSTDNNTVYKTQTPQKAIDMVETWAKRFLFDEFKNKNSWDKFAAVGQNIASAKYMMLNITGGIGNVLTGSTNIFMERFAGEYFNHKDWENAKFNYYIKAVPEFLTNMNSDKSTNLTDAIIKLMSVVDYEGIRETAKSIDTIEIINKMRDFAYSPQTAGEHFMQNTAMLSMMLSNRIYKDQQGNVIVGDVHNYNRMIEEVAMRKVLESNNELSELYDKFISRQKDDKNKLKDYLWFKKDINTEFLRSINDKSYGFAYAKLRDELTKESQKEFDLLPKVIDQFELVEGYAKIKEDSLIDFGKLAQFKGKVISVNKKIHGVYDKLGGARIESTWVFGSLVMQYHKFIYNGALKHFRVNGYYNESRESVERGFYVSLWDFATTEFKGIGKRSKNQANDDGTNLFIASTQQVCRAFLDTFINYKFNYATMSNVEKANCRRALGELMGIAFGLLGGIAAGCALVGIDDDDETAKLIANLALYQADRLSSETIMYNIGAFSEFNKLWSSPVAIGQSFKDVFSAFGFIAKFMTEGNEFNPNYTTGRYKGENKLGVYIKRQIPIYRNIERINQLDQNNKYYKLGDNMLNIVPTKNIVEWLMNED